MKGVTPKVSSRVSDDYTDRHVSLLHIVRSVARDFYPAPPPYNIAPPEPIPTTIAMSVLFDYPAHYHRSWFATGADFALPEGRVLSITETGRGAAPTPPKH